jgi:hypothetical protein
VVSALRHVRSGAEAEQHESSEVSEAVTTA